MKTRNDNEPMDPRGWDNLGKMICFHSRYNLGDYVETKKYNNATDFLMNISGIHEQLEKLQYAGKDYVKPMWDAIKASNIILPLYLYDHSGITMSTGSFSCAWDSGQVGWIYISNKDAKKEYGWKHLTDKRKRKILEYLKSEVETYDDYITGNAYGSEETL